MNVNQVSYRTIWVKPNDPSVIQIIDQRHLPHEFVIENISSLEGMIRAIKDMHVRGAPLIGVAAAYGVYLALREKRNNQEFEKAIQKLRQSRPTAVNLEWAIQRQLKAIANRSSHEEKIQTAFQMANQMADEDVQICQQIGEHGLTLIENISRQKKGKPVQILTHCNAGWLACVDWGTATAPIYKAFNQGIKVHVWVSETRPRNQGASLTAWELFQQGIPHTVIVDNAAGHLIQHGMVDLVIVGTDRTTSYGDVANKIGTYLKALAAKENNIPFYVAAPSSSIDWQIKDGTNEIPIEERSPDEVKYIEGSSDGAIKKVLLTPKESAAKNYAFDVTPAKFVSGLITERGICQTNHESIARLFPEIASVAALPRNDVPNRKGDRHEMPVPFSRVRDEGVIKFNCKWIPAEPLSSETVKKLNDCRNHLYDLGFIGVYEDGIGFGNISIRSGQPSNQFIISGTQTGNIPKLTEHHYTQVTDYDLAKNSVTCKGPVKASSESLTHAMLYDLLPDIQAVIHVHHKALWTQLLNQVPTTSEHIPYGTPEMALEVKRLCEVADLKNQKIFVMAGHEDGIITFGKDLTEATAILMMNPWNSPDALKI